MTTYIKDPDAVLDYTFDWSRFLQPAADTISASTWSVTGPDNSLSATNASVSADATATTAWLSGGTLGAVYLLTNHITTAGGRQDDRTVKVQIQQK